MGKVVVIPGKPHGKARPRFSGYGRRPYTPEQTRQYEDLIRVCWKQQAGGWDVYGGAVGISIRACFPIPKSASQRRRDDMISGRIRPTVKPDGDNILKIVKDALNGLAYFDDKQVVEEYVAKVYDADPKVEFFIYKIDR